MTPDERKKLPKWASDRLDIEESMGKLETSASIGTILIGLFVIGIEIGAFIFFCVVIYLIGKAIAG